MSLVTNPRVGVGVIVLNDQGHVLLGLRTGSHGAGTWGFPGGAVEYSESVKGTAIRELLEETGLHAHSVEIETFCTQPYITQQHVHWVTLYMRANGYAGELQVMESHKCSEWKWFDWEALPTNLFEPVQHLKDSGWTPTQWRAAPGYKVGATNAAADLQGLS